MDPYLEAHWLDVHPALVVGSCNAVQSQLNDELAARIDQRLVVDPIDMVVESEPVKQRFIKVLDLSADGRVVTYIEFLSPSNKVPGEASREYKQKQLECRDAGVNLVEVDLTRSGERELLAQRWLGAGQYQSTYQVSVWRASPGSRCELYKAPLQERLPVIRIPLRPVDDDALLDIQAVVDVAYASSRYDKTINYRNDCKPPLNSSEAAWVDELLKSVGKR